MKRVVCFGEIMLRLSPPGYERIVQAKSFDAVYGGAEANVAISLANFGVQADLVTKLPDNPVGDACRNELRKYGVGISHIKRGGDRLGIFFCEKGASLRPSVVVYDRANSAIAGAQPGDFDWDAIFRGADWFHFTGITPALGDGVAHIAEEACRKAKAMGLKVSCDLNYRKKLWSREKAAEVMGALMRFVDLLIANEEDAADVFGIHADGADVSSGSLSDEGYRLVGRKLIERFGIPYVAITLRESMSASDNGWSGLLTDGRAYYKSKRYVIHIVDRVGGGDSFGAGLIYGFLHGMEMQQTLDFAAAASALKQTVEGDFSIASVKEVNMLAGGDASGRVQR